MLVLTIDTSTRAVTAGLVRLGRLGEASGGVPTTLTERVTHDARAHAEVLTPQIMGCLADASASPEDLDAVVVGRGPGPFTGLRVGMVTAASFGHALGIPVHGVCSLDAIAAEAGGQAGPVPQGEFLVVTDARRREVYWARYRGAGAGSAGSESSESPTRVEGPAVCRPDDLDTGPANAAAGSPEHTAQLGLTAVAPASPTSWGLAAAAVEPLRSDAEPAPLEPLYLRRPDVAAPKPRRRATPTRSPA